MQRQGFSPKSIEYFERDFLEALDGIVPSSRLIIQNIGPSNFFQVKGLPKFWGEDPENSIGLVMENLISGIFESKVPLIFTVFGEDSGLEICYGTFTDDSSKLGVKTNILKTCLESSFHGIKLEAEDSTYLNSKLSQFTHTGILTGTPSANIAGRVETSTIERLMRGISGTRCGIVVIAKPMSNDSVNSLFTMTLNEIKIILESERYSGQENPTVRQYKSILEKYVEKLQRSKSQGLWVSSYFMYSEKPETLDQLKAVVKSAFSGRESIPDRIRTLQVSSGRINPGLITNSSPPSPGQFKWPYIYSNLLVSGDLASITQLPNLESPGYQILPYVRFNVSKDKKQGISIGEVLDQGKRIGSDYSIPLKGLKKHGLIVGGTGSGKTNTIFYMLKDLILKDIPILVLEPAKTEYRKLLYSDVFRDKLRVYTLGDNNVSPFRLNPFKVHEGVPVQMHLDLLKSVFNASFYMWGPLPHVLERCLYDVYTDKGWDLSSNSNSRGLHLNAYPTLTDLYNKVDDVVEALGYSPETTMELRSSLKTRLNSLRIGGKGLMLDTKSSISFEDMLKHPTVLELEPLGDDEEKAFMMGLILTMMYEYYISKGLAEEKPLSHITVIEEAHRLLGVSGRDNAFTGDMKGKAVETFTNILSEIRAYGEGFLIAEQIPTKLSTDVIKNTNLKVMHRIVSEDDRRIMASSMNVNEKDADIVTTLSIGEAVVYSEGDDGAYDIQVPYAKIGNEMGIDEDELIRSTMSSIINDENYISPYLSCSRYCKKVCSYKDVGEELRNRVRYSDSFHPLLLSLLDSDNVTQQLSLMFEVGNDEARIRKDELGVKICTAVQGAENFFEDLGSKYHWSYTTQESILTCFLDLYVDSLTRNINEAMVVIDSNRLQSLREAFIINVDDRQPTGICKKICVDGTCRYRYSLIEAISDTGNNNNFVDIINRGTSNMMETLFQHCLDIASNLGPTLTEKTIRKMALCYALQKSYGFNSFKKQHIENIMNSLLELDDNIFNNIF